MADLAELEARIRRLEDIEAIKRLKHRYFNSLDSLLWDELVDCFAEDGVIDYEPDIRMEGKKDIVEHIKEKLHEHIGVHQGHNPEIQITSDTTATGKWELFVYAYLEEFKSGVRLGGYYHDEYVKEKGEWKIRSSKMTLLFFEAWEREALRRR